MKLMILDRDGVINEDSPKFIKSPDEWHAIPGSLEAIVKLNQAGYVVVVATNQSGVARGYFSIAVLKKIHQKMLDELDALGGKIERIYYCPHHPDENCECRKPKTGMFQQIAQDFGVKLNGVCNIGDALRDMQAGEAMDCHNILVLTGKGKQTLKENPNLKAEVFDSLVDAVNVLLDSK